MLQFSVGYVLSFLVFFFGTLFTGGSFGAIWMPIVGWTVTLAITTVYAVMIVRTNAKVKQEYALAK